MKALPDLEKNFIVRKIKRVYRASEWLCMNIHEKCLLIVTKITTWNFYEALKSNLTKITKYGNSECPIVVSNVFPLAIIVRCN